MINKETLIENGVELISEKICEDLITIESLEDIEELHDILLNVRIDGERIEDSDKLHDEMVVLLEEVQPVIIEEIESEMDYYYGIQAGYDAYYADRI